MLRVQGENMIGAGILDGDFIIENVGSLNCPVVNFIVAKWVKE